MAQLESLIVCDISLKCLPENIGNLYNLKRMNISNSEVSLTSCDIGIAQLAMHSSYEILGAKDVEAMKKLLETYFSASLCLNDDGFTVR